MAEQAEDFMFHRLTAVKRLTILPGCVPP